MSLHTAGPKSAASSAQTAAGSPSGSTINWVAPGGGGGTTASMSGSTRSVYLLLTNCGFTIDGAATIVGIVASITRSWTGTGGSPTAGTDYSVKLLLASTPTGTDKSAGAQWTGAASYGGPSDLWGTTPLYSDVNGSGFGVGIAGQANGSGSSTLTVSVASLTVYYTLPDGVDSFAAAMASMGGDQAAMRPPPPYTAVPYRCLDKRLWLPGPRRLVYAQTRRLVYAQTRRPRHATLVGAAA